MSINIIRGSSAFRPRTDRSINHLSAPNAEGFMRVSSFAEYCLNIDRSDLIGAWFPGETSGTSCLDNSDQRNHATACQISLPEVCVSGVTAGSFNGASSYINVYSTGFNSDFYGNRPDDVTPDDDRQDGKQVVFHRCPPKTLFEAWHGQRQAPEGQ